MCFEVLTEKNFNKTVFAEDAKSVVFFNDVEEDDPELDQYECFMQVSQLIISKILKEPITENVIPALSANYDETRL